MEQRVVELFNLSIEAKMAAGETLVAPISRSSLIMVEALLAGARVFTCGNGLSATLASTLSHILLNQFRIERPGFPSFCLSADSVNTTGLSQQANFTEIYSRQIRTLSQPGDLLVLFSANSNAGNLVQAIQTAHDREMTVIAFTGAEDNNLSALLMNDDVEIHCDNTDSFRVQEIQLLSLFCLCELIEEQLFGG